MDEWEDEISTHYNYRVRQPELPREEDFRGEKHSEGKRPIGSRHRLTGIMGQGNQGGGHRFRDRCFASRFVRSKFRNCLLLKEALHRGTVRQWLPLSLAIRKTKGIAPAASFSP